MPRLGAGDFVISWQSGNYATGIGQDGSGYGAYAQRYSAAGAILGPEFRINSFTTGDQKIPVVAMDAAHEGAELRVIIETPTSPVARRPTHVGTCLGGLAPMASARPGSHSATGEGASSPAL